MSRQKDLLQSSKYHAEFKIPVFANRYEGISDTFIDTSGAADSLKKLVPKGTTIFEVGLGTGYFAQFLSTDGYHIAGIQPADEMVSRLRNEHPEIDLKAEAKIEDYIFTEPYDAIVSHSSIFLVTRLDEILAEKLGTNLIFQSFEQDGRVVEVILDKIMNALTQGGRFFINIQPNPLAHGIVDENLSFDMLSCDYDLDRHLVSKVFRVNDHDEQITLPPDISMVLTWDEFNDLLSSKGYKAEISEDGYWVSVSA